MTRIPETAGIGYTGSVIDRCAGRRSDPAWLSAMRTHADTRVLPFWQDQYVPNTDAPLVGEEVFLGIEAGAAVFAVDLQEPAEAVDVRSLFPSLTATESAVLAYAKGLLHWHRHQRFCGTCGGGTRSRDGGHLRVCLGEGCGRMLFPRIEPAVITLVEHEGRCLLGRHRGAAEGVFSTLAGFVEIGESVEDAVRREVAEEAGVTVGAVTYQGSQPWPFPSGLMLGFRAEAVSDAIEVDGNELVEADWFAAEQVRRGGITGRADSIDSYLIETWLREHGSIMGRV
ncbi:MAG: NAD(+) diphosphatase [Kutzneria sp.]|nr:NAD(+) diphosphatase [Kutzneria sp.]MBV9844883.1 NAD(+) diphosphatase [Kutzneria sp.]